MQEFGTGLYLKDGLCLKKSIPSELFEPNGGELLETFNGEEKRVALYSGSEPPHLHRRSYISCPRIMSSKWLARSKFAIRPPPA
jgi:hypothetical protein